MRGITIYVAELFHPETGYFDFSSLLGIFFGGVFKDKSKDTSKNIVSPIGNKSKLMVERPGKQKLFFEYKLGLQSLL